MKPKAWPPRRLFPLLSAAALLACSSKDYEATPLTDAGSQADRSTSGHGDATSLPDAPSPRVDAPSPRVDAPSPRADAPSPRADAPSPASDAHTDGAHTDGAAADGWGGAGEIWFSPRDFEPTSSALVTEAEYMALFSSPSPWPNAAAHVSVLKTNIDLYLDASSSDISQVVQWVSTHNMKLAVGVEPATSMREDGSECGVGEGYSAPGSAMQYVNVLQKNGVVPDILAFDEPLWFAHYSSRPTDCQYSIAKVIEQCATFFSVFKAAFPNIQLESFEPVGDIVEVTPTWADDVSTWVVGLANAGAPVSGLADDLDWRKPLDYLPALDTTLTSHGVSFGLFLTGDSAPLVASNAAWMAAAEEHWQTYNAQPGLPRPGHTIVASWNNYPTLLSPETSPDAITYLINYIGSQAANDPPPNPVYALRSTTGDQLLTAEAPLTVQVMQDAGWVEAGIEGKVYPSSVSAPGLVPLCRASTSNLQESKLLVCPDGSVGDAGRYTTHELMGFVFSADASVGDADFPGLPLYELSKSAGTHTQYSTDPGQVAHFVDAGWTMGPPVCDLVP